MTFEDDLKEFTKTIPEKLEHIVELSRSDLIYIAKIKVLGYYPKVGFQKLVSCK